MLGPFRVLIVIIDAASARSEDDLFSELRQQHGVAVTCAAGLHHGLDQGERFRTADVVVLNNDGLEHGNWSAVEKIRAAFGEVPIAVVSDTMSIDEAWSALNHGIRGIICKHAAPTVKIEGLKLIAAGETYVCTFIVEALRAAAIRPVGKSEESMREALGHLTPRELVCVRLMSDGLPNLRIAQEMNLSETTVKLHLHSAFKKMGVRNRTAAMRLALLHGMQLR